MDTIESKFAFVLLISSVLFLFVLVFKVSAQTVEEVKKELRETIALYIIAVAEEKGVDAEKALSVARCESGLNFWEINHTPKEYSVGIFQINTKVHDVTIAEAKNPVFNVDWAMTHLEKGSWWMWKNCLEMV